MNLKPSYFLDIGAAFAAASMLLLSQRLPAISGENYEEEIDRFDDTKTATYKGVVGAECSLTKALKGELHGCTFIHRSTRSTDPSIVFFKTSDKEWDLRDYGSDETVSRGGITMSRETVKVILTFPSGVTKRRSLPAVLSAVSRTDTVYDSTVVETLFVRLGSIKDELKDLTKLEVQYGSAEFLWINDRTLTSRAIDFVKN